METKTMGRRKLWGTNLIIALVMCVLSIGSLHATSCYTTNVQKAEALFRQGRYADAKKRFTAAKACPDKPSNNNLSARIAACERKIKEQSSSSSSSSTRRQSSSSSSTSTQSASKVSISNISFANAEQNGDIIDQFGTSPFKAARVHYIMPQITYNSTYTSTQTWQCYVKIYNPDGTLKSSSSSPSGYTYSFDWTVSPGNNVSRVTSWGNKNGGSYNNGTYRYELWRNGSRLAWSTFTVKSDRSGTIDRIWVDYDQYQNGQKGMLIHAKFTVSGMKGRDGRCAIYFKYKNGTSLNDYNNSYCTSDGKVCLSKTFAPGYDDTEYSDLQMFMPYDELHLSSGSHNLKFYVLLYDEATSEDIVSSDWKYFDVTQP